MTAAISRQSCTPDEITIVRAHDQAVLTVTRQDVLDYRATHNINQTRAYFRDLIGTFLEIDPAEINNRMLMEIASNGDLGTLTVIHGDL